MARTLLSAQARPAKHAQQVEQLATQTSHQNQQPCHSSPCASLPPPKTTLDAPPCQPFPVRQMLLRSPTAIFFLVLFLCGLTAGGHLYSPDEEIMFRVTEAIATRGALDIEPIRDGAGGTFATKAGAGGREFAQYGIGNSLAEVPLYWVGSLACRFVPDSAANRLLSFRTMDYLPDTRNPGHARLTRFAVSFTGSFIAAATAALLWMFAYAVAGPFATEEHLRRRNAGLVACTYALATMAWPHARTMFSEPLATLCCLLSLYFVSIPRTAPIASRRALYAGLAFAAALFTRLDSAIVGPGIALMFLSRLSRGGVAPVETKGFIAGVVDWIEERFTAANFVTCLAFALPLVAFALTHFALNHIHFGNAMITAYADQREGVNFSTPIAAGLYGYFMSVGKSMFLFSPGLILGVAGFALFRRYDASLAWALVLIIALKILVHSKWQNWPGGWCWGPRHIFLIHAFAVLPAVAWFSTITLSRRIITDAVLLAGVLVQLYGCSQNFIDYYWLYYRTPFTAPMATVMYAADDTAPSLMRLSRANPATGQFEPASFAQLIAPINDSIYVPQNSQWYRYEEMWNDGYTDNLWLRLLQRARGKEPAVLTP